MESLGLNRAGMVEYQETLARSHDIRVDVTLLDLRHRIVGTARMIEGNGQVMGDRFGFNETAGPQRRLSLTMLDRGNTLGISGDTDESQLYYDRIVQVTYGVLCPTLGWVDLDVFTGLPWKLQSSEGALQIEADDLSRLGWEAAWKPLTIQKGVKKTTAIRRILARAGFNHVRLPERDGRLAHALSLGRRQKPWQLAARVAASMDLHLYVDGSGIPTGRRLPGNPLWTFDAEVVEPLAISTDRSRFANTIEVVGRKPKGEKRRVRYVAHAPSRHPLSARSLAHNGEPYRMLETIQNDHFRTTRECRTKAERVLADRLRQSDEATIGILPWPHVTPGDLARFVSATGEPTRDRFDQFTLPLGVGDAEPMRVNWLAKDSTDVRRIRR